MDYCVTITQTGKHQTTLFVLSVSTDPSLHCLLVCLVVKYPVHNESQNLGPSVSRCGEYTALCCNCDSTRTSILSVSVLTTSLEISPPPSISPHFLPCLPLSFSLPSSPLSPLLLLLLSLFPLPPPLTFYLSRRTSWDSNLRTQIRRHRKRGTERERQRQRYTERDRDRQTNRNERERERPTDRQRSTFGVLC